MNARFRHKITREVFTAETFSVSDTGTVFLQRLAIEGRPILGGDCEIAALDVEPVNDTATEMMKQAEAMAEDDKKQHTLKKFRELVQWLKKFRELVQ